MMEEEHDYRLCGSSRWWWKLIVPLALITIVACCGLGQHWFFRVAIENGNTIASAKKFAPTLTHAAPTAPKYKLPPLPPVPSPPSTAKEKAARDVAEAKEKVKEDEASLDKINKEASTNSPEWVTALQDGYSQLARNSQLAKSATIQDQGSRDFSRALSRHGLEEQEDEMGATRRLLGSKFHSAETTKEAWSGDVVETYSVVSFCKDLWEGQDHMLAISMIVGTLAWPVIHVLFVLWIWVCRIHSDIRQGVSLCLVFLAKWALIGHFFLTIWIPILKLALPGGREAHLQAEWGCALFTGGVLLAYVTVGCITTFEHKPRPASHPKVDSSQSVPFHAVFFTLAAITTLLLVAALSLPAYTSTVTVTIQPLVAPKTTSVERHFTLITAGLSMMHDNLWTKVLGMVYIIFVTTFPGMFVVSAVVAWVTSPLEREGDADTNFAMAVCNHCGRLVSFDVWLYAFGITYLRIDDLADFVSYRDEYNVSIKLSARIGLYAAAGCIVCMWMMHTLAQYAHQTDAESWEQGETESVEPTFSPPGDLTIEEK